MRLLPWVLQILILSAGIHLFLSFVRHTRGSRLIRGLYVSVLLAWVGLWGLSKPLGLEELEHILQGATGFLVVVFAIVFQPELRRGIAQLGERSFGGGTSRSDPDIVRRVARAAKSMAARRHGALIAFEREASLNTYVETGAQLDAEVSARLIETLFNPKGPLHDGAIVLREGRIAAAGCFFPLPQEGEFDPSMGTRHRAALGLTEENDALVVVVSEETGSISIAQGGTIRSNVTEDKLEEELNRILSSGAHGDPNARRRLLPMSRRAWRNDAFWMLASVLLALGILLVAHQDIRTSTPFTVRIRGVSPAVPARPVEGELLLVLPDEGYRLADPDIGPFQILAHGSRSQIAVLGGTLAGTLEIDDPKVLEQPLDLAQVDWKRPVLGLDYTWEGEPPQLELERFEWRTYTVRPEQVRIDDKQLNPRYEAFERGVQLGQDATLRVQGPVEVLDRIGNGLELELQHVVLGPEDRSTRTVKVGLSQTMRDLRLSTAIDDTVTVTVPIGPAQREAGVVEREIALVSMEPDRADEVARWSLPAHAQNARFTVSTSGLVPANADPGSPALLERLGAILRFVEENLVVYVDVAELPENGREVPVRWSWRKDWRSLQQTLGLEESGIGTHEGLEVELETEKAILLERREPVAAEDDSSG